MEIIEALDRFSETGKPVIAIGDYFTQSQYLLASQADTVFLHPEGGVSLMGFGVYRTYLKQFLENIRVNFHVFRAGDNKSAVEPYMRDDMSPQEREVVGKWLNSLWGDYTALVEKGRNQKPGEVTAFVNDFPDRLEANGGDLAEVFLQEGYVDELLYGDDLEERVTEIVDARDDDGDIQLVSLKRYVSDVRAPVDDEQPLIAIIPIEGTLIPGDSIQGSAGSGTVVDQLERADEAGAVAIVLRINSGGGSVFASEVIRAKVDAIAADGVPIVVSMGGAAASGGYWLAYAADEICVDRGSIVGSIGVISAGFGFSDLIGKYGVERRVHTAGKSKSQLDPFKPENPEDIERLRGWLDDLHVYFIDYVKSRRAGKLAEGTDHFTGEIWIGQRAVENGLADGIGHLVSVMKDRFGDKVSFRRYEQRRSLFQRFGAQAAQDVIAGVEERASFARFGL